MPEKFRQSPAVAARMQRAAALQQQGDLEEADRVYRLIIRQSPRHFDALHLCGIVAARRGQLVEAERLIGLALTVDANSAEALNSHGIVLKQLNRLDAALVSYDRALAIRPDYPDALNNRGNVLTDLKRFDAALASYDRALSIEPGHAGVSNSRGIVLYELNRFEEALASYDHALAVRPGNPAVLHNRGIVLHALKRPEEALASYNRALGLRPDYVEARNSRGVVLRELHRLDEALASHDRALAGNPGYAEAHNNRGIVLRVLKRAEEALASYQRALAIRPDYAEALNNAGVVLQELGRLDEALASYQQALAIRPDYAEALTNRGGALQEFSRIDEALASYQRAQAISPDHAEAHWNEALCRLLAGDFAAGWPKYEWRWRRGSVAAKRREFTQPLWLGEPDISEKTVLLHAEQGFGDTIQFSRYAKLLAERGAQVILEVQPELKFLLTGIAGVQVLLAKGEPLPDFHYHCPLLSLPLACGTTPQTIPAPTYLAPRDARTWQGRLPATPRIGLAWAGNPDHRNDRNRSIPVTRLAPLLDCGAKLISLQKEIRGNDLAWLASHADVQHFELSDFSDTAALISLLDVVVTVDTAVAHLAGAMGKPVWIMLPASGVDWRWMLEREDSPWYPSARLFRQPAIGDWDSVINRVANELRARIRPRPG